MSETVRLAVRKSRPGIWYLVLEDGQMYGFSDPPGYREVMGDSFVEASHVAATIMMEGADAVRAYMPEPYHLATDLDMLQDLVYINLEDDSDPWEVR